MQHDIIILKQLITEISNTVLSSKRSPQTFVANALFWSIRGP